MTDLHYSDSRSTNYLPVNDEICLSPLQEADETALLTLLNREDINSRSASLARPFLVEHAEEMIAKSLAAAAAMALLPDQPVPLELLRTIRDIKTWKLVCCHCAS